jgi:hypothetical protein
MADPILDQIWRVRAGLLERYGGLDGYFKHIQKLDRARLRRQKAKKLAKSRPRRPRRVKHA